jgi:hypothetical protein
VVECRSGYAMRSVCGHIEEIWATDGVSRRAVLAMLASSCAALALLALGGASAFASPLSHTQAIDSPNSLNAVSCMPATTDCVVSDSKGNALYSTDVSVSADATWKSWSGPDTPSQAVACPSSSLCVLADGVAPEGGGGNVYYATSLGGIWKEAFSPVFGVDAISCASTSLCVTGQKEGERRYSTKPGSEEWEAILRAEPAETLGEITAADCLTGSFCAAVDSTGHLYVANTQTKIKEEAGWKSTDVDGATALHGIACTSATSCLAVDGEGNILDLAINGSGEAMVSKQDVDGTNDLTASACTGLACAAVDRQGNILLSANGGGSWIKQYETGTDLTSVSCSSNALCLAADTTGEVIAFASARASIEACGAGGGVHPAGSGGRELCEVVNPHGTPVESCQFEVGVEANTYTDMFPCESASLSGKEEPVEVTARLEDLAPATIYHYRLSVTNKNGTESGPEGQFKTEPVAPSVISESVSGVTEGYATLDAQINPGGEASYYAEYGPGACEANACGTKTSGEGFILGDTQEEGSLELTNLKPNTTYHYWVVATNSAAPAVHGEAKEFTTPKSWEEIRNEEDEQFFKQRTQEEAKTKAEVEARTATAAKERQEEEAAVAAKKRQEEQASAGKASVTIVKAKVNSSSVAVTLEASKAGTITISGRGLKTTARSVAAGTAQIRVMLTAAGKRYRKHHTKVKLTVQLKAAGKTASGSKTVKL